MTAAAKPVPSAMAAGRVLGGLRRALDCVEQAAAGYEPGALAPRTLGEAHALLDELRRRAAELEQAIDAGGGQ